MQVVEKVADVGPTPSRTEEECIERVPDVEAYCY